MVRTSPLVNKILFAAAVVLLFASLIVYGMAMGDNQPPLHTGGYVGPSEMTD